MRMLTGRPGACSIRRETGESAARVAYMDRKRPAAQRAEVEWEGPIKGSRQGRGHQSK